MKQRGSLYKQPGSAVWWLRIGHRGRMLRESTGETDVKKARKVLQDKRDELGAARIGLATVIGPETRQVTVRERLEALLKDFELRGVRSLAQIRAHMGFQAESHKDKKPGKILEAFGSTKIVDVAEEDVKSYVAKRKKAGAASATINRETQLLGQAIRPFLERLRLPVPEIARLPENNVREGFFSRAELEAVVSHLPDDLKDFCRWAYLVGWRKGEVVSLKWADVDAEGRTIRLSWRKSKNKKARTMVLAGELAAIIERRSAVRADLVVKGVKSDHVFCREDGRPVNDIRKAWKSACKAAGVKRHFHDLRRTGVRNMTRAGVEESVAMVISGHKTRAMFDRYNITDEADIADAVVKTQAYVETLPTTEVRR
jgi:integrase